MLGPLEVRDSAGSVLDVGGARVRGLLILLALRPGQLVTSSQLIEGLWGEEPPAEPVNALQALVSRLRRAVPEAQIQPRPAGYQLMLDPEQTDVVRFERLAARGRRQLRDDPATAARTLGEALTLWRGPAEVAEAGVVARLEEVRLGALQDRITADLRLGRAEELIAELEGLTAAYPTREPLAGLLMRALQAAGRRNAALEVYERTRKRLADQLGMDPSAELAALHLELLRASPEEPGTDIPRSNLPAALTSFVGRDAELGQVAGLLTVHRLVTLTGPGGAGKTRLAVETARAQEARYRDGVWLVELAPVADPAEVATAVLTSLGLREQSLVRVRLGGENATPAERLRAGLAGKHLLLVLDNSEHLIGAVAGLAEDILTACPHVAILATSREPLNITGEALLPVGPLALKPATDLLEQRASAVRPGFVSTPAVTQIARALDGMPLAIELAAARMRTMDPEQVAQRLDDRFRLLTGGSRTALPRHQTLRAVVDWSWDLLDQQERVLWCPTSVFPGDTTPEEAEQVCAGGSVAGSEVLDLLTALADKSVVTIRPGPRYSMLEIIKAYGRERLAEAGESEQLRQDHARYFLRVADESREYLLGRQQLDWMRRLSQDQENLHAAIRGAVAVTDADTAVALAGSVGWYWWLRTMKAEGTDLCAAALALADGVADTERLASAYMVGGLLAFQTTRFGESLEWLNRAAELTDQLPWPLRIPALRLARPLSLMQTSWQAVTQQWKQFDDVTGDPDPWVAAIGRVLRGQIALNAGAGLDQAEADFRAAAAVFDELGERWGAAAALGGGLVGLELQHGEVTAAIAHAERAVVLATEIGAVEDEGQFRLMLGRALWMGGQRDRATAELDRATRDAERIGLPETLAMGAYFLAELARWDGQRDQARNYLGRAAALTATPGLASQWRALVTGAQGWLAAEDGDLDTARRLREEAYQIALPTADSPVIAQCLTGLADQALREGDRERAAQLLAESIAARGSTDRSDIDEQRLGAALESADGERREHSGEGDRVEE
jgi:predicted ATPase/DNA-binding SARP family transcriptional activator